MKPKGDHKRYHPAKLNRSHYKLNKKFVNRNQAKFLELGMRHIRKETGLTFRQISFLLYIYDLEFFTINHISYAFNISKDKARIERIRPMVKQEYVRDDVRQLYLEDNEYAQQKFRQGMGRPKNYYALTQKGRNAVQRFYRILSGEDPVSPNVQQLMVGVA